MINCSSSRFLLLSGSSPPGRPVLLGCRSPEKETFTCWWDPGMDGGLPTTHRLYYQRERLEGTHECPDYHSAGRNTCFFDKNHTSIWVDYYLTVVACNALGNATSDVFKIDVMDIVKPDSPERVALEVENRAESPSLHVSWEHPRNVDTKSGWVTLEYQLRARRQQQQGSNNWKAYKAGAQTRFTLYSVHPGAVLMVQVRCRLDHGIWSEWSDTSYVKIPNNTAKEKPLWILVLALSASLFLAALCIVVTKRKSVTQYLLPPVPGPKIRGLDVTLLKSGRPEDLVSALIISQGFPSPVAWKDHMDDYLMVSDNVSGLLPDKGRRSLVMPPGFGFDSKHKNGVERKKSDSSSLMTQSVVNQDVLNPDTANCPYVDLGMHVEPTPESDYSKGKEMKSTNVLLLEKGNQSSYVDVPRPASLLEDYSQVEKVNGDKRMVILQKGAGQLDSSCREAQHSNRKTVPRNPHRDMDLIDGGYVDKVPTPMLGKPTVM
ncbi:prolactin receptor b isoform X2 [Dunckerocampus dactyliophorus]|uniref:prolactin receptor b isoform X2 n=1 Tax=Dunckerocampus dactyliophorus TaxID=161453 RepID=UPI0024073D63|nr:prolactin receptor b isoform X2 [Dunckerocampus dactyliophorus]